VESRGDNSCGDRGVNSDAWLSRPHSLGITMPSIFLGQRGDGSAERGDGNEAWLSRQGSLGTTMHGFLDSRGDGNDVWLSRPDFSLWPSQAEPLIVIAAGWGSFE